MVPVIPSENTIHSALAMGRLSDMTLTIFDAVEEAGIVRARANVVDAEWMVSLEMLGHGWRGRARHGSPGPTSISGFGVSNVVLVDSAFRESAPDVPGRMLSSTAVRASDDLLRAYFEVYGVQQDEVLDLSMTLVPMRPESWLSRLSRFLGLGSAGRTPGAVRWSEAVDSNQSGFVQRTIGVSITELEAGDYELTVTVTRPSGALAISKRTLRIVT
jgi:hypothetical protein